MPRNSRFFEKVNYASFHEDSNSERRALKLTADDRVLCLTGSGARPLDLLLDSPGEIVAIDWNPAQSHLLELKASVIRNLDYQAGLMFLGFRPSGERLPQYAKLRNELSEAARAFWDRQPGVVRRGVFFEGQWERFLRRASWLARTTRRQWVAEILAASDLQQQHDFWVEKWDNPWWRRFLAVATNRLTVRYLLREPGLEFVPAEVDIAETLRARFVNASQNVLFRESPWVWALFNGQLDLHGPLPEHLLPENFDLLRQNLNSLTIQTVSLEECLKRDSQGFDAYSLSDFCSYCDRSTYDSIWRQLVRRSRRGARICERRFLVEYPLPPDLLEDLDIDDRLAEQLAAADRSVVYTFRVARTKGER